MSRDLLDARVSVLLAVRNGLPYVENAIASVLGQTMTSIELIVIDDGSEDGTGALLDDLAGRDGRLHVLRNPHSIGLTRSLNLALQAARGSYIARIDHDDLWLEQKLALQLDYLERNPQIGLLATAYREDDLAGRWTRIPLLPMCRTDVEIRTALYRFNPFFHSSILIRRGLLIALGGYDESYRYAQDYELWTRLLTCTQAATLPDVLCVRRVGNSNISYRKERAQRFNALRAKLAWARRNGFSRLLLLPLLRDLAVIFAPGRFKLAVRSRLHASKAA